MRDQYYQFDPEMAAKVATARGVPTETAAAWLAKGRESLLARMREDPYRHGYEPPIWTVARALMRGYEPTEADRRAAGGDWEAFCAETRRRLGFARPVGEILIMGANRSGKTDFAAKLAIRTAMLGTRSANIGMQTLPTGKQVQMPRVWHYLPKELKARNIAGKKSKDNEEHISYTKQNGFSSSKITFGNGSDIRFISYDMDVDGAMEGSALDYCWLDEEFPKSFLDAARFRLASKRGFLLGTFTPVSGYTPVVKDYLDGMTVTRWHTAYMLPVDGGPPEPWNELGLRMEEWDRLCAWRDGGGKEDPGVPEARPESYAAIMAGSPDRIEAMAGTEAGRQNRRFEVTPRIAVCKGGEAAAIWFFGRDNPYGMPGEVIANARKNANATAMIRKRVYGIAEQVRGVIFKSFAKERNVVRPEDIPKKLVRIMVVDPAPERNWAFGWYGYDPATGTLYKYREWPGGYEIPGVGVPGPWAVPSDRKGGINDGDRGDGQDDFGFGFLAYKREIARLEGWACYDSGAELDEVEDWSELDGTAEPIEYRVIDARAASQSKIGAKENTSLFEQVSRLAEGFVPASGQKISVGLDMLQDLVKSGRYKVSAACVNTIAAYGMYTGADGQKGACKDMIDLDRYAVLSGIMDYGIEDCRLMIEDLPSESSKKNLQSSISNLKSRKRRIAAGGRRR